jgi:hypothetical protein
MGGNVFGFGSNNMFNQDDGHAFGYKWFMGLLGRLFGAREDPTAAWEIGAAPLPVFDLDTARFGTVGFGDGVEAARFLGKPDRVETGKRDSCSLLYGLRGFQMQFCEGKMVDLAFFLGQDEYGPKGISVTFCKLRVRGTALGDATVSGELDRSGIERLFGEPKSVDADGEETILFYTLREIRMEFELDEARGGKLKRWNVFTE